MPRSIFLVGLLSVSAFATGANDLLDRYQKAKTEHSCDDLQALSKEPNFPLQELAKIRAEQTCENGSIDPNDYTPWLKSTALDAAIELAQKRNDWKTLTSLAIEKSKLVPTPEERLTWGQTAVDAANQSKDADLKKTAQTRLFVISPRLKKQPLPAEYLSVADDCRYNREFKRATSLYRKILAKTGTPLADRLAALKGLRQSFKNSRDQKSYLKANNRLIDWLSKRLTGKKKADQPTLHQLCEAMVLQARALWTHGQPDEAMKAILRFEHKLKGKWPITELLWVQARIREEKGDLDGSNRFLLQALKEKALDPEVTDKINWSLAWNLRRQKRYPESAAAFEKLKNESQNESTQHRAAFWLGKVQTELKKTDEAKAVWEKLTQEDPLGFYGLTAFQQLHKSIVPVKAGAAISGGKDPLLKTDLADALIKVDELDALASYLDEIARNYKKTPDKADGSWVQLLKYYAHAGLYIKLYEYLGQMSVDQRNAILETYPTLLFPRPFEEQVKAAAADAKIEPELIYSIMRQESAFNPKARSAADAFGLMQVVPEAAREISNRHAISFEKTEDLYDPAINIRIGAQLLHEQFEKYHEQFILTVASYNANDQAIHGWMANRFHGDAMEFIEDIPYEETRGYVRLIARNYIFYRLLAGGGKPLPFPDQILSLRAGS